MASTVAPRGEGSYLGESSVMGTPVEARWAVASASNRRRGPAEPLAGARERARSHPAHSSATLMTSLPLV